MVVIVYARKNKSTGNFVINREAYGFYAAELGSKTKFYATEKTAKANSFEDEEIVKIRIEEINDNTMG